MHLLIRLIQMADCLIDLVPHQSEEPQYSPHSKEVEPGNPQAPKRPPTDHPWLVKNSGYAETSEYE